MDGWIKNYKNFYAQIIYIIYIYLYISKMDGWIKKNYKNFYVPNNWNMSKLMQLVRSHNKETVCLLSLFPLIKQGFSCLTLNYLLLPHLLLTKLKLFGFREHKSLAFAEHVLLFLSMLSSESTPHRRTWEIAGLTKGKRKVQVTLLETD